LFFLFFFLFFAPNAPVLKTIGGGGGGGGGGGWQLVVVEVVYRDVVTIFQLKCSSQHSAAVDNLLPLIEHLKHCMRKLSWRTKVM
jgi:uncharacterized spore protein YtfJ